MDSYYYGRLVIPPLNIVLYNIFSEHGPDLYGTSPWSFYFLNGFLNFNLVFPLGLAALPTILLTFVLKPIKSQSIPLWLALLPLYTWIAIFFSQPHKVFIRHILNGLWWLIPFSYGNVYICFTFFLGGEVSLSYLPSHLLGRCRNVDVHGILFESFEVSGKVVPVADTDVSYLFLGHFHQPSCGSIQRLVLVNILLLSSSLVAI